MTDNETVADVVRDFDAMAAECGGLEAATIHAMTLRANAAHAREVEALRQRAEAAEAALNIAHSHIDMGALHVSHYKDAAAIDAAIGAGRV